MTKQEIRTKYLRMRLELSRKKCEEYSQKICDNFFSSIDLSKISTIHTFLPIVSKNEVNTWLIIDRIEKDFPRIKISIPKIENNLIVSFYFEGREQLEINSWGILEPVSGEITQPEVIDLVIVPLLAFDQLGNRVGYGKGFYDRFLKTCRKDCEIVGLSFFEADQINIPHDNHDISLKAVITPLQKHLFGA